jgi:hypothetical protein
LFEANAAKFMTKARFDGNSELVAELVTVNGFKAAYAIKDGAEGPRGWMVFSVFFTTFNSCSNYLASKSFSYLMERKYKL